MLLTDTSAEQVSGARFGTEFERLPAPGEKAMWKDPDGRMDNIAVGLLAGGGLLGAGLSEAHAQSERNSSIQPLRDAMARDRQLQMIFDHELRRSVEQNGHEVSRAIRAESLTDGHAGRAFAQGDEGMAMAVQQVPGYRVAMLTWDDRQPLLAVDIRFYARHELARGVDARQKSRRVVRYAGLEAPDGSDYLAHWSSDNGRAFRAEVENGLRLMLPLAWDTAIEVPKVSAKEQVVLQVRGTPRTFAGRLRKHDGGAAYLFNKDRGITIVATDSATAE